LIEALLKLLLRIPENEDGSYGNLLQKYRSYLNQEDYPYPTFIAKLTKLNLRWNRIHHQLWWKGFSFTNRQTEPSGGAAVLVYGLFIEWLETFDSKIRQRGFR